MSQSSSNSPLLRYLAIAVGVSLLLTGVLAYSVERRANILRSGAEVVLKTVPVDPRDLLRGDYVVLSYDVSTIPDTSIVGKRPSEPAWVTMSVRLKPGPDGYWAVAEASFGDLAPQEGTTILRTKRFHFDHSASGGNYNLRVDYGIERFYVPEGAGMALEEARNMEKMAVVARVGSGGSAQIRHLLVDGQPVYEEPLY
ncbi:MAG: GDYXXLXY domain-containing protein [Rhizobium sp.]